MALFSLPDDLLLKVLRFLDTRQLLLARGVCKRLRDLALHPLAWTHRDLTVSSAMDAVLFERAVLSLAPCLNRLVFEKLPLQRNKATSAASQIGMAVRDVERLCVGTRCAAQVLELESDGGCTMATRILENQATLPSRRLRRLELSLWPAKARGKTALQELVLAVRGASSLLELQVDLFQSYRWKRPGAFLSREPAGNDVASLKKLFYSQHAGGASDPILHLLLKTHALTLELVELSHASDNSKCPVFSLLARCANLSELHCPLTGGILELAQCSRLVKLHLRGHTHMKNWKELIQSCWTYFRGATRLRYLSFSQLHGKTLFLLQALGSSGQSALETLELYDADRFSDSHWHQLVSLLPGLPQLRTIHLSGTPPVCFLRSVLPLSPPWLRELHVEASIPCPRDTIKIGGESAWDYVSDLRAAVLRNPGLHVWGLELLRGTCKKSSSGESSDPGSPGTLQVQTVKEEKCECWQDPLGLPDVPIGVRFGVYSHDEGDPCDLHGSHDLWVRLVSE